MNFITKSPHVPGDVYLKFIINETLETRHAVYQPYYQLNFAAHDSESEQEGLLTKSLFVINFNQTRSYTGD